MAESQSRPDELNLDAGPFLKELPAVHKDALQPAFGIREGIGG